MEHKYSDLLKKNSIMPTKQRLEIADIIFKKHQHFTANELIERIKISNLPISLIVYLLLSTGTIVTSSVLKVNAGNLK